MAARFKWEFEAFLFPVCLMRVSCPKVGADGMKCPAWGTAATVGRALFVSAVVLDFFWHGNQHRIVSLSHCATSPRN
jgi:hypothetical protein